ncbi:hypothetical protein CGCA056_v015000 [Colletotrichum aenigma]|uniref:uncharacterized protein n=1 Tax=Colletotrichum aenigma TaxID=1215731 RepID=UPI0018731642|nr:uncharacterized protein CGCA056_v015000 [Colletotrichum aenigma]KAF5498156.1 hypothetical protein CGCA056_v015000 [Colletotrichum aenigma]
MSSAEDARFVHTVFAVREDQDGGQPEFIDQPFKLNAVYQSSASALFRLSTTITDSASIKTTIYLQITPDRIASLQNTTCDTSDANDGSPSHLERVRQRLGGKRLLTRLQFHLHSGLYAQLIVPTGFARDEAPASPAWHAFRSTASLATVPTFSIYMPHNVLPMTKFETFFQAVRQFPTLTATQRQSYERMVDLRRLYSGKGGVVFTPEDDQNAVPLRDGERNRSATPSTESCASTVPFDTVPRHQDSPPQYDECVVEGPQPRASMTAAAAAAFVKSARGDDALPEYGGSERQHRRLQTSKRVLHCGSEEIDLHPSSKRAHFQRSFASVHATTANAQRPEERSESQFTDAECVQGRLAVLLEQQRQQIQRLQEDVEELRRRNKELEGRHDEVEDNCGDLENRQTETEETVESLLIHTGELDEECEKLGKQMPDLCDEMEDWVKDNLGDAMKEHMNKWLEENMAETINGYINEKVAAQIAQMKAKMRKALSN